MSDVTMSQGTTLNKPEVQLELPGVSESQETSQEAFEGKATDPESISGSEVTDRRMLAEARQTRQMIVDFQSAVESGNYSGHKMRAVATGLAFLEVLLRQNTGHIKTLQAKIEG